MPESSRSIDVFISRRSNDRLMAAALYDFLTAKGLTVFDADKSLPLLGNSDYRDAIDEALDQCSHMIVIGSSVENICSSWVKAEWGFYISEKRADRKVGNILTIIDAGMEIKDLPGSLRNYEVIEFETNNFERIGQYVGIPVTSLPPAPEPIDTNQPSKRSRPIDPKAYVFPEGVKVSEVPRSIFFGHEVLRIPSFSELGLDDKLTCRAVLKCDLKVGQWVNRDEKLFELTLTVYSSPQKKKYFWQSDLTYDIKTELLSPVSGLIIHLKEDLIGYYTPYPLGRTPMVYGGKNFFPVILLPDNEPPASDYFFKEFYRYYQQVLSDCWPFIQFSHRHQGYVRMGEVYNAEEIRFNEVEPELNQFIQPLDRTNYGIASDIQSLRTKYYDLRDKLQHLVE